MLLLAFVAGWGGELLADEGVIRLRPTRPPEDESPTTPDPGAFGVPRRGFDYQSFQERLETLWFQRRTLLADGRETDAARQSQRIRAFCTEEGIQRVELLASALISEANRFLEEGDHDGALDSLSLAESFDPGRPQIHQARAAVLWSAGNRIAAAAEHLHALKDSILHSLRGLSLINQFALVLVVALVICLLVFSTLMVLRYQVPFRHEVEEWVERAFGERWAPVSGWTMLFLPAVVWFAAGWIALYWVVVTFRFMRRGERLTAVALLATMVVALPAYRVATTIYGITADPAVRTTIASSGGEYDPDRILKLQELVRAYPEDPVYHFLLAGLYKNGRYFDEAFGEYRTALNLDPAMEQAYINLGNIFYTTGQYAESVASYRNALEVAPGSLLAYFNMHLAQSESFRFKEAEQALNQARSLDSKKLARLLSLSASLGERPSVFDATLQTGSVWVAAIEGRRSLHAEPTEPARSGWLPRQFLNPFSLMAALALVACAVAWQLAARRGAARRCIRCGRPFCHYCKSGREGHEYCSQCYHLYVLGDGLAPETKTRKLYEVERYERRARKSRRLVSIVLPGAAHLLKGRAVGGSLLLLLWLAALIAWQPIAVGPLERMTGLDLQFDLLGLGSVPAIFSVNPLGVVALAAVLVIWVVGNFWGWRRGEV
jgi:tetratricopeptide (TPR) repeat protein